jgi:hypothetical protein
MRSTETFSSSDRRAARTLPAVPGVKHEQQLTQHKQSRTSADYYIVIFPPNARALLRVKLDSKVVGVSNI